jgi:hypothetical protein
MATTAQLNAVFDALKADLFHEISDSSSIPFWAKSSVTGFLTDDKILRAARMAAAAFEKATPAAPAAAPRDQGVMR